MAMYICTDLTTKKIEVVIANEVKKVTTEKIEEVKEGKVPKVTTEKVEQITASDSGALSQFGDAIEVKKHRSRSPLLESFKQVLVLLTYCACELDFERMLDILLICTGS